MIAGKTNKTIAGEIYMSEKTVEFHLNNIYTKIGVRTRMMTGVWAIRQGLQTEMPRNYPGNHRGDMEAI